MNVKCLTLNNDQEIKSIMSNIYQTELDICCHIYLEQCHCIFQIYSVITSGRVLIGELHVQRLHELIYLYLFTDCFLKISLQSSEQLLKIVMMSGEKSS